MTVVEVVPLVAGAAPIVVRRGIVGAVVGVLGLLVKSAGLGVLDERLGVKVSRLLAVKSGAHLFKKKSSAPFIPQQYTPPNKICGTAHFRNKARACILCRASARTSCRHGSSHSSSFVAQPKKPTPEKIGTTLPSAARVVRCARLRRLPLLAPLRPPRIQRYKNRGHACLED